MARMKEILKDYENSEKSLLFEADMLPVLFRDEQMDLLQNCGFNGVELNEYQYGILGENIFEKVIEVLEERNLAIKFLLFKAFRRKYGITRALEYDYRKHKNFVSIQVFDEPTIPEMEEVKGMIAQLEQVIPENMYVMTNLYPCYVDECVLGGKYEEYVDKFFKDVVATQKGLKVVSCDYYPFMVEPNGRNYMCDTWAYNHMLFAKYAKEYGAKLEWCIQSCNYNAHRIVDAQDIKMQLYMCLAFGVTYGICFFTYSTPMLNPDFTTGGGGMIGPNFTQTTMYYAGKDAISEIRKIEKYYLDFEWQGSKSFDGINNGKEKNPAFAYLTGEMEKFAKIDGIECYESTIISELYDKEKGRYAYVVVNYNDPIEGKEDKVKFNVKDAKSCVAFIKGEPVEYGASVEFTLERGGGALIIIEK